MLASPARYTASDAWARQVLNATNHLCGGTGRESAVSYGLPASSAGPTQEGIRLVLQADGIQAAFWCQQLSSVSQQLPSIFDCLQRMALACDLPRPLRSTCCRLIPTFWSSRSRSRTYPGGIPWGNPGGIPGGGAIPGGKPGGGRAYGMGRAAMAGAPAPAPSGIPRPAGTPRPGPAAIPGPSKVVGGGPSTDTLTIVSPRRMTRPSVRFCCTVGVGSPAGVSLVFLPWGQLSIVKLDGA